MILNTLSKILVASTLLVACGTKKEPTVLVGQFDNVKGIIKGGSKAGPEWHHKDLILANTYGVSDDKAYKEFDLQQKNEVIVAVIDSGVDIFHEDLKDVIWVNKKEIPGNGIDDDKNGFIDDINGWNFIGGVDKDGKPTHIDGETLEVTRIFGRLSKKKDSGEVLTAVEEKLLKETATEVSTQLDIYIKRIEATNKDIALYKKEMLILEKKIGLKEIKTKEQLFNISTTDSELQKSVETLKEIWAKYWKGIPGMFSGLKRAQHAAGVYYNTDFDARATIVGDNPSDFNDTNYGNNDVKGPDSAHGTHVSGIIAASRNNGIGYNGISNNVKIMVLRAVPNGDERDKDIALSILYAVDNGAKIINMSFGKGYSPYKSEVDTAMAFAASRGVLIIHAAGNDGKNIDFGKNNYPNSYILDGGGVLTKNRLSNWIEVGASAKNLGLDMIASFSNHGKDAVTLFAPGKDIMSTTPENNYETYSGTSMACPVTAGVASLLMAEFPTMTGSEARGILLETVSIPGGQKVRMPTDKRLPKKDFRLPVPFTGLSQTGGVVNAYEAMSLARDLAKVK